MNYFAACSTFEELRKDYRILAKALHPDNLITGNKERFQEMQKQYEVAKDRIENVKGTVTADESNFGFTGSVFDESFMNFIFSSFVGGQQKQNRYKNVTITQQYNFKKNTVEVTMIADGVEVKSQSEIARFLRKNPIKL